jgi:FixJ family two-component response regulator
MGKKVPRFFSLCIMPDKPTVHVVEDEPIIANTLAIILNAAGFEAMAFNSEEDCLGAAKSAPPPLLITDVAMPGIDGIQLAIQFKTLLPDCKILLLTGQASTEDLLVSANKRGHCFEIIAKPVHPKELLAKIKTL